MGGGRWAVSCEVGNKKRVMSVMSRDKKVMRIRMWRWDLFFFFLCKPNTVRIWSVYISVVRPLHEYGLYMSTGSIFRKNDRLLQSMKAA